MKQLFAAISSLLLCLTVSAYSPDYYAANSRLSQGNWVRIKVNTTGVQALSDDVLRYMGFNDPEKVGVYGYGGVALASHTFGEDLLDDLPEVPTQRVGDKLLFYGEADVRLTSLCAPNGAYSSGVSRNFAGTGGCYFLCETDSPLRIAESTVEAVEGLGHITECRSLAYLEEELTKPDPYGARLYGKSFVEAPQQTYELFTPGRIGSEPVAVNYQVIIGADEGGCTLSLGGETQSLTAGQSTAPRTNFAFNNYAKRVDMEAAGTETLTAVFDAGSSTHLRCGAPDYLLVNYPRNTSLASLPTTAGWQAAPWQTFDFFNVAVGIPVEFTDVPDQTEIWDVTVPSAPVRVPAAYSEGNKRVVAMPRRAEAFGPSVRLMAFSPDALRTTLPPDTFLLGGNQNLHATPLNTQMVILASDVCRDAAEQLAQLHRDHQRLEVAVVGEQELYNEFSSGTPSLMAVRRYLRMLRDRNPSKPLRSLLLFGEAHNDNRCLTFPSDGSVPGHDYTGQYLPIFEVEDSTLCGGMSMGYATDAYFGCLSDKFNPKDPRTFLPDIAVGRVPASTAGQADVYVQKMRRFMETAVHPASLVRSLQMADLGNRNGHLNQAEETAKIMAMSNTARVVAKEYLGTLGSDVMDVEVGRRMLKSEIEAPAAYIGYCGHAYFNTLGSNDLLSPHSVMNMRNSHMPMMMVSACDFGALDLDRLTMAECFLFNPAGGTLAMIASGRAVMMDLNQTLSNGVAREFHNRVSSSDAVTTGQVYLGALQRIYSTTPGRALAINNLCYNLIGDPETPVPSADRQVRVTYVSRNPEAGQLLSVKGDVLKPSGSAADLDYSGEITMFILDTEKDMPVKGFSDDDSSKSIKAEGDVLLEVKTEVRRGKFNFTLPVPTPTDFGNRNRLVFAAIGEKGNATGAYDYMAITEGAQGGSAPDISAPVISSFIVAGATPAQGGILRLTPSEAVELEAEIVQEAPGVLVGVSSQPARSFRVSLDNQAVEGAARALQALAGEPVATLSLPLGELAAGAHTVEMRIYNSVGQWAGATLNFTVDHSGAPGELAVEQPEGQGREVMLTFTGSDAPKRLLIEDIEGNTVKTYSHPSFPLRLDAGTLAAGRYTARAIPSAAAVPFVVE